MNEQDPFLALCVLASREKWCWKICCTTCGHMNFRYSFRELIAGKHPDSQAWVVSEGSHNALNALGPLPPLSGWPIAEQRALAQVLIRTNVGKIHQACRFPDWLGYLGLAIAYTEDAERKDRIITPVIVPQLITLVQDDPKCSLFLSEMLKIQDGRLRWRDLETVELGIQHARTQR